MPMMFLNVETVSAVSERMAKDRERIADRITSMNEAVRGLQMGAWVGNAASQFFGDYEMQKIAWERQVEIMRILAERMRQEIEEWVNAASRMG